MATSKSASETFSRLGVFGDRAMPRIDHIPDPKARKIVQHSDKTFGNCYNENPGWVKETVSKLPFG